MNATPNEIAAGGISIHAFDVSRGVPAGGLAVRLMRIDKTALVLAEGSCAENGHFVHPVSDGDNVVRGVYEVEFGVGTYFRTTGVEIPDPAFLDMATFRFGIDVVTEHFHLPFKFTPWGFSLFRGGA